MTKGFISACPQEQYIKLKYLLSSDKSQEKHKKKRCYKAATKWKKLCIMDGDLDLKKMAADELCSDDELQYETKEDKPVIDERPKRKGMKSRGITVEDPDVDRSKIQQNATITDREQNRDLLLKCEMLPE